MTLNTNLTDFKSEACINNNGSYNQVGYQIACSQQNKIETHQSSEFCKFKVIQFYISVSGNTTYSRRLTFINNGATQYQGFRIGDGDYYFDGYISMDWSTGKYGMAITEFGGWSISACVLSQVDAIIN